jgi:hypothetical protein
MPDATFKFNGGKCVGRIQPKNHRMVLTYPYKNKSFTATGEHGRCREILIKLDTEGQ